MERILVADDDESIRNLIYNIFFDDKEFIAHIFSTADDLFKFYEYRKGQNICLVLTDLEMPEKNGVWLVEEILSATNELSHLPAFVLMSGAFTDDNKGISPNIYQFKDKHSDVVDIILLSKPFTTEKLFRAMYLAADSFRIRNKKNIR